MSREMGSMSSAHCHNVKANWTIDECNTDGNTIRSIQFMLLLLFRFSAASVSEMWLLEEATAQMIFQLFGMEMLFWYNESH